MKRCHTHGRQTTLFRFPDTVRTSLHFHEELNPLRQRSEHRGTLFPLQDGAGGGQANTLH